MELYRSASDVIWKTRVDSGSSALLFLEKFVNGSIIQWHRIQGDLSRLPGPGPGVDAALMTTLFLDIHFFFVCADKVQALIAHLAREGDELQRLWDEWRDRLRPFNDARNFLEHIDREITLPNADLGNLVNDSWTFAGQSFDISLNALAELTGAYEAVIRVLRDRHDP